MSYRDHDLRAYRLCRDGKVREIPLGESKLERDANTNASLDRAFIDDIAREERRRVFRCSECNGIAHHHPNCPNADDGQDDDDTEEE